jgi:6-phosphogluconolactonase
MKFSNLRQLLLVSAIGLVVATLFAGCQLVTIDYVFVATGGSTVSGNGTATCPNGEIETYAVDSESGAIRKAQPEVCSGGTTPIALAVSPGYQNLYVANQVDKNIVHFAVANNGVLSNKDNVALTTTPVAMAVSPDGNTLYVVSGSSSATLSSYSLSSGALGSQSNQINLTLPGYPADTIIPTGVTVLANGGAVYVTVYDRSSYNPGGTTSSAAPPGWVFGFATGSGGALTPTPGSPYNAGVKPSALVADPTNRFVYVTDFASNQLIGYGIYTGFQLNFLLNGPYKSGGEPSSIAIDPRGKFLYIANALDSTVSAYVIDLPSGTPSSAVNTTGSQTNSTDTQPLAVAVDPALGRFVYTANYLGNSVSGFRLDPTAGTLKQTNATPYPLHGQKPTAVVLVPHGNHASQTVTP